MHGLDRYAAIGSLARPGLRRCRIDHLAIGRIGMGYGCDAMSSPESNPIPLKFEYPGESRRGYRLDTPWPSRDVERDIYGIRIGNYEIVPRLPRGASRPSSVR